MSVPITSSKIFEAHLRELGLCEDMDMVIHSNLMSFGRIEGGIDGVYNTIRKVIGVNATIIAPTYNMSLTSECVFDPVQTPAIAMGVFSNYMMQRSDAVRTLCPMHSHVIEGPKKDILMAADTNQSLGPGSIFQVMMEENFYLLLLGCTFHEGATFVHHVEASIGVFYREWLNLPRKVLQPDGTVQDVILRYYARKNKIEMITNLQHLELSIRDKEMCNFVTCNQAKSYQMQLTEFYTEIEDLLTLNPTILMDPIQD